MPQANVVILTNHSRSTGKNSTVFCYCIGQKNLKKHFEGLKAVNPTKYFHKVIHKEK